MTELNKTLEQLKLEEKDIHSKKILEALKLYNTLSHDEKIRFDERVFRLTTIGKMHKADAAYATMESILNMRKHQEWMASQGKKVHHGMRDAFDTQMLNIVPVKHKEEIIDQELKDKFGSVKKDVTGIIYSDGK